MKKQLLINTLIVLVAVSPLLYLLFAWNSIPPTFTTRFEFDQAIEKVQTRESLLTATITLSVVSVLLYILMRNLRRVDPKVTRETPTSSFHKLGLAITLFLVVINYVFILSAEKQIVIDSKIAIGVFGMLIMTIGNYMNNLKPNYVAGIRLPWTLNDPENWRKTHQLAAKIWFAGGIVLIIISFLLSKSILIPSTIILFIALIVIPGLYSYKIYRRNLN
ncbi:SdpI family protein [Flavitalea sp.]|nr:SdpI family protein [Flavitalea sp.]